MGPGTLSFYWKVSSEADKDFLNFYLDSSTAYTERISGDIDWEKKTYVISSGSHYVIWAYTKDASGSVGSDAAWVDYVQFTSATPTPTPSPSPTPSPTPTPTPSSVFSDSQVFINEIHYNDGSDPDENEGVEIAALSGMNLKNWKIINYWGSGSSKMSSEISQNTLIQDQNGKGFGTYWLAMEGLADYIGGLALVDPSGYVVQFISYGGVIAALDGAAVGLSSKDIIVNEDSNTLSNYSLQLKDTGDGESHMKLKWNSPSESSVGQINNNETLTAIRLKYLGEYPLSKIYNVFVSGNYAYVSAYNSGMIALNISDPENIVSAGSYPANSAMDCYVSGSYCFVADGQFGLRALDVSNPDNISEAGNCSISGTAVGIKVVGSNAFIAAKEGGLRIVDITLPDEMATLGYFDTEGSAVNVFVSGNYAYVADSASGMRIINVTDPNNLAEAGFYSVANNAAEDVFVSENHAYIAFGYSGIHVVDISNPASPTLEKIIDTTGYAKHVNVVGNYAYISDLNNGVVMYDISSLSTPALVSKYSAESSQIFFPTIIGDKIYAPLDNIGLVILQILL